jgi:hypothetical protein
MNGSESEGPTSLVFAPAAFPGALQKGVFVAFFGRSGSVDGLANEENPVLFYDFGSGQYHEFISNGERDVQYPMGMYSSADSLFLTDLWRGSVYQISAAPEPSSLCLLASAAVALLWLARGRMSRISVTARSSKRRLGA